MNQSVWKKWLEDIFEGKGFDVVSNPRDRARNVYVCRSGSTKRLISIWPNKDLMNVVLQNEVQEYLDGVKFKFEKEPILVGNRYDYRQVTEAHVLEICRNFAAYQSFGE